MSSSMARSLFIITQKYPLLNAINIKLNDLKHEEADLILDDDHDYVFDLACRIRKESLFKNVFIFQSKRKSYIKLFLKKISTPTIEDVVSEIWLKIKDYILYRINLPSYIKNITIDGGKIDFSVYNKVFVCCSTRASFACTDILYKLGVISEINLVEEGVRDYCQSYMIEKYVRRYSRLKIIQHLYDKDLVSYNKKFNIEYSDIPKLSKCNSVTNFLNRIFGWNGDSYVSGIQDTVVFFEQVAEPMPSYLVASKLNRIILKNAYRKHMKEHLLFLEKCSAIERVIQILKQHELIKNFRIKVHPRTVNGLKSQWKDFLLDNENNSTNIPWELYCLNIRMSNCKLVTLFSSSVVNSLVCLNSISHIKIVLLYELMVHKESVPNDLMRFYQKVKIKYPSIICIPSSKAQLDSLIVD